MGAPDPAVVELPIRPASTVLLVRDSPEGLQVFLLERVAEMAFAAGKTVFPGGAVDRSDHQAGDADGPGADWWAEILQRPADDAIALVTAAMRELYEETGVLLTTYPAASPDPQNRLDLDHHRITWAEFLQTHGLRADPAKLRPWSRWITPTGRTRRYDTYFFVAVIPDGQQADALTSEAVDGHWSTPRAALDRAEAGEIQLMRPTKAVLAEIADYAGTAELLAATVAEPLEVRPEDIGNGERLSGPGWPVPASRLTRVLLAPNPGPMTLDGTNSYLIAAPGSSSVVVVDPGPDDVMHLAGLVENGAVELVLITHRHIDHTAGSLGVHFFTDAPVRALDPEYCLGGEPLVDGEVITAAGVRIEVIATPGHSSDSVCFRLPEDVPLPGRGGEPSQGLGSVLTGDTILGRGTTVLAFPDGSLTDYLRSLDTLVDLGPALTLPAHGPTLPDLAAIASSYRAHRHQRLDQVRAALTTAAVPGPGVDPLAELIDAVTAVVYAEVPADVQFAARKSVAAQVDHLIRAGELADPGSGDPGPTDLLPIDQQRPGPVRTDTIDPNR